MREIHRMVHVRLLSLAPLVPSVAGRSGHEKAQKTQEIGRVGWTQFGKTTQEALKLSVVSAELPRNYPLGYLWRAGNQTWDT